MSRLTKAKGNMYDWVTHTHSHLAGECPHGCGYCYVQAMARRFPAMKERYSGPLRLIEGALDVDYGSDKTIFVDHLNDLFAKEVPYDLTVKVFDHCYEYPGNHYVFQTKNPMIAHDSFWLHFPHDLLPQVILGTTIETNRRYNCMGKNTYPEHRAEWIREVKRSMPEVETFVTIEPILDFDVNELLELIDWARPNFVCIGADSKGCGLPEPWPGRKVGALFLELADRGIEVRSKRNLVRLWKRIEKKEGGGL